MPSFSSMEAEDMTHLIGYLRSLSGGTARQAPHLGDRLAGRAVYDRSGCSGCHRIGNEGSTYGPDLSRIGAARSVEYLRDSVVKPSADIPAEYEGVTFVGKDGKRVTGLRANEDTFTIQLKLPSQKYSSFRKSESLEIVYSKDSLMPAYTQLSTADLNNLLEYLLTLNGAASGTSKQSEGIR